MLVQGLSRCVAYEYAKGEALVDDEVAAVLVAQAHELGEWAEAAAVMVEALDEEEAARALGRGLGLLGLVVAGEHRLERADVIVREGVRAAARELDARRRGEVDALVKEEQVALAYKGRDDGRGRCDAERVDDRRLHLQERRELLLEVEVHVG